MNPPPLCKLDVPPPPNPDRSFFTGQERDGVIKARLVVDNGTSGAESDITTNDLPPLIEKLMLLSLMECARSRDDSLVVRAGDVSGAYYATRADGYLKLPSEWPPGEGGFQPGEIVRSKCAMPGSQLASGLFLTQLDNLITMFPRTYGTIRTGKDFIGCNYSDDLLGIGTQDAWNNLQTHLNKQYSIEFEDGYPARWVGMDFEMSNNTLHVGCASSCERYENHEHYLPTQDDFAALKPEGKSTDEKAISEARKWVGRLNYAATLHPA